MLTRSDLARLIDRAEPLFPADTGDFGSFNIALRDAKDGHLVAIRYGQYLTPERETVIRPKGYALLDDTPSNRKALRELYEFYEFPANAGLAAALARLEALPGYTTVNQ